MPTRSAAVCSICYDGIRWDDRLVLPCKHVFCRGCIDHMFLHHHRTADDYASQCPMCRAPLMGEADELFTQGSWCLAGFQRQVELQMFQNSQSGEFGPFSRFVPVAKNDGKYVLVLAGEYEDLKKQKKVAKQKFLDDADARPYEARAAAVAESNARAKEANAGADGED